MRGLRIHHTVFVAALGVAFALMAIEASGFRELARWFPFWFAIVGAVLCGVGVLSGLLSIAKARAIRRRFALGEVVVGSLPPLSGGSDPVEVAVGRLEETRSDTANLLLGLRWFAIITGYVALIRFIGFEVASLAFILLWFNLVHRWPVRKQVIAVVAIGAAMWVAQNALGMRLP